MSDQRYSFLKLYPDALFFKLFSVLSNLATSSCLKEADERLFMLSCVPSLCVITVSDNRGNVNHSRMLFGAPNRQNPFSLGRACTSGFLVTF